ncbi:hypothetical protein [Paracoccus spongiarum]|uniref:Uncharacterized protein n=1 Tax=Paracoccus spongiarum TaxID=3064387 RepID=A0ABT9JFZ9_9RHOB|nr:hypothetical protein [Paracoccus sp. 2205BS29-5]MDP5308733.1 hypothetical protein [Paracoccus sp. 2205BS29-5]
MREVLEAQPKVVAFGELALPGEDTEGRTAAFSSDGKAVDAAGLAIHSKALAFQRAHPGTGHLDAVRAVS